MVKFSKQLEGQLVPEWRPAYVNYKILKKELKQIKLQQRRSSFSEGVSHSFRATVNLSGWVANSKESSHGLASASTPTPTAVAAPPARHVSRAKESFDSLVALGGHAANALRSKSQRRRGHRAGDVIEMRKLDGDPWDVYETILLEPINRMEAAKHFFARLDGQFNKVNQFYYKKEKEFVEQAQILEKQMQALVDMRKILEESQEPSSPDPSGSSTEKLTGLDHSLDLAFTRLQSMTSLDLEAGEVDLELETARKLTGSGTTRGEEGHRDNDIVDHESVHRRASESAAGSAGDAEAGSSSKSTFGPQMIMRMRIPITTPGTSISALTQTLWGDVLKKNNRSDSNTESQIFVTKKKLQKAEKMLRTAFIEYYRGLCLLKSYSSLNMVAFAKILKKFDKVSGYRGSAIYLKVVESSYFNTSDKIITLMEKVETLYTTFFAKYNRHKAMLSLRPRHKKSSHTVTFILGVFVGGSLALLAVFAVLLRIMLPNYRPPQNPELDPGDVPQSVYVKTIFPTFSMVMLVLIHMYMYGADLYFWRRMRINYAFIFEFTPGTELRHREVFMVTSVLTTVLVGSMVGHLALHSVAKSPYVDFIPLGLVMLMVGLLFFPLNILYRSSRLFFLNAMLHIIAAPLYNVVLADFFLADQLTSQVPMFRNLQYVLCYFLGGFFKTGNSDACFANDQYKGLTYLISLLPYWWRFMQRPCRNHLVWSLSKFMKVEKAESLYQRQAPPLFLVLLFHDSERDFENGLVAICYPLPIWHSRYSGS